MYQTSELPLKEFEAALLKEKRKNLISIAMYHVALSRVYRAKLNIIRGLSNPQFPYTVYTEDKAFQPPKGNNHAKR